MAKKHRKLFPLLSETNKTLDCSTGVCDSVCPYNCYTYPDYYTISPQPPPQSLPPPPLSAPSPSIPAVYQESPNSPFSPDVVTIITIAGAFLAILLTGFVIATKIVSNRVHRIIRQGDQTDGQDTEEFLGVEQVDHPIWFIRTTGLQQSIINSITICRYKRGDGLIERTDCPVCLNEFEEHESLRLLPKCNHAFHISCIDTWLRSHTNCPLCRASVLSSVASRSSAPANASPEGSGYQRENNGNGDGGEGRDGGQRENRAEPERNGDVTALKDPMSSSYSLNRDPNSDAQMESSHLFDDSDQNSEDRPGDESKNHDKPEQVRVFKEPPYPNLGNAIDSVSHTVTQAENSDFPGESCETQDQEKDPRRIDQPENNTEAETETEDKPIGEEASCSDETGFHDLQSRRMSLSMGSGESQVVATEDTAKSHLGSSSNTSRPTGSSRFNRNMSSVFPL